MNNELSFQFKQNKTFKNYMNNYNNIHRQDNMMKLKWYMINYNNYYKLNIIINNQKIKNNARKRKICLINLILHNNREQMIYILKRSIISMLKLKKSQIY